MAAVYSLGLEATELRLGLPGGGGGGGGGGEGDVASKKRGFEATIDLKLKLETASPVDAVAAPAAEKVKKSPPAQNCVVAACASDPEKPPAPKAQVVGWPPVRSYRKNILAVNNSDKAISKEDGEKSGINNSNALVKVCMDGAPYLRKVDLNMYKSYQDLSMALDKMFSSFTTANCGSQGINGSEFVPTYEDKDGDWMLVGDVPWEMFVDSCKRLRIMKGSEAVGLASAKN